MFGILALSRDIAGPWSPESVFSVFGVLYIIVAIGIIWKAGGLNGGLTLLSLACLGALCTGIAGPGINPEYLPQENDGMLIYVACYTGPAERDYHPSDEQDIEWRSLVHTIRSEEKWRLNCKFNEFDQWDRDRVDPSPKIYAMHCEDFSGYISPKIFHPAAFFWSPFIMAVIGVVGSFVKSFFYF